MKNCRYIVCVLVLLFKIVHSYNFWKSNVRLNVHSNEGAPVRYTITRGADIVQDVIVADVGLNVKTTETAHGFIVSGSTSKIEFIIEWDTESFSQFRVISHLNRGEEIRNCFQLGTSHWFGGPQHRYQFWPVEKYTFSNFGYVSAEANNTAITERYWLSGNGLWVYVSQDSPLFLDQTPYGSLCLTGRMELPYSTYGGQFTFEYRVGIAADARLAHMEAIKRVLKKPTGHPDERMVRHPIWSTWARYKAPINHEIVQDFANEILKHKFQNAQLEIDDNWEECYGALTFSTITFPNVQNLVKKLKEDGFRVTLWAHPFINKGCEPWYSEAKKNGYFVLDHNGNADTQWWNSKRGEAGYIDFTKPAAATWYVDRLKRLQEETGIDSFKFDAGETSWSPADPKLVGASTRYPNLITSAYIKTVAQFGPLVEVRSGQGSQKLPIFMRMIDKDSEWGWQNGLSTLITTLLQLNMVGYPFVLPDMIGGNGYLDRPPSKELFIRWLQANVFMPSLQFSYVPWDYDTDTYKLSHFFVSLHDEFTDEIMTRFKMAVKTGDPVNPPIWWTDPTDKVAQSINDEFMLGDRILVAPVTRQGQVKRDIYLPKGSWTDGNNHSTMYTGGKWIYGYNAPLNVLPYFIKK